MALLWMEKGIGGFAKEGMYVEVLSISSGLGVPVLIANDLDAVEVFAAPVLSSRIRCGATTSSS